MKLLFMVFVLMTVFVPDISAVGTGKVVIGLSGQTVNPVYYSIARNEITGQLSVFLQISPDGTAYDSSVEISCEAPLEPGFSQIAFPTSTTLAAASGTTSGTVSYTATLNGRPTGVQCYGVSASGTNKQFTKATSMSTKVEIEVTKPAAVHFCSDIIKVPNINGVTSGSFSLELSETVATNAVTISCSITTNVVPGGFIAVSIPSKQVAIGGSKLVRMTYTITTPSGKDIQIVCLGESVNSGKQYIASTSTATATFREDQGFVRFYPSELNVKGSEFKSSLVLNERLATNAQDINFVCDSNVVTNKQSITDALTAFVCKTGSATPAPTNWAVSVDSPVFKQGQTMNVINVKRNTVPTPNTQETLLVICCIPDDNNASPKYKGIVTSMLAHVELTPALTVNLANATNALFVAETAITNPAFVKLSPCPCDKLPNNCDIGCCCDVKCTFAHKETFECISGIEGGEGSDGPKDESCDSTKYLKPDWHLFLCVFTEDNPLLGSVYETPVTIKTNNKFIEKEKTATKSEVFAETESRALPQENINTTLGYTKGISIKTKSDGTLRGPLSLPSPVLDGKCDQKSPVRYLTNTKSTCVYRMTEERCTRLGSSFSARNYVQHSNITSPPCTKRVEIVGKLEGSVVIPIDASYRCITGTPNDYIISKGLSTPVSSSFDPIDKAELDKCVFNDAGVYECPIPQPLPVTNNLPFCDWDDQVTQPPEPGWDNVKKICRNSVLDVKYKIYWIGTTIKNVTADIIMGDVPEKVEYNENVVVTETVTNPTTSATLTEITNSVVKRSYVSDVSQSFNVEFLHDTIINKSPNENFLIENSGNPGYIPMRNLISAIQNSDGKFIATKDYFPRYFKPTPEKNTCTDIETGIVKFDEQISGSCLMHLSLDDFNDCYKLRQYLLFMLGELMPFEYISMVGHPNLNNASHWLKVNRQNLTNLMNKTLEEERNLTSRWSTVAGRCDNMPVGIHLDIVHADSGRLNGQWISRIKEAEVVYQFSTLQLSCTGANSPACDVGGTIVTQPFLFYSSANFDLGRSFFATRSRQEEFKRQCWQEICEDEAMFPFTRWYEGETYEQSILWMIVCSGVFIGVMLVTRPYSVWF